jgi:acyl-homoserine lactone acylase PvdQ
MFRLRISSLFATALAPFIVLASAANAQQADTGLFLNILPPGNSGHMSAGDAIAFFNDGTLPVHIDDQRLMYSDLITSGPGLQDSELENYFKSAPLGLTGTTFFPPLSVAGLEIKRDAFGVPQIKGKNRAVLMRGIGLMTAVDRMFSLDLIRRGGRGRLSEFLGADAFNLSQDESLYAFAGYDEADLQQQLDETIARFGALGRRVRKDVDAFVDGVNSYINWVNLDPIVRGPVEYFGLDLLPIEEFKATDVVAVATQLEFLFGAGGGREHRNANLLQKLTATYGPTDGRALYDDLRNVEDPDAPVTTTESFPFLIQGPIDPAAVAMPDLGSVIFTDFVQLTGPAPPPLTAGLSVQFPERNNPGHPSMSNFLGVSGEHAAGGHPIAVMGPQMAYFVPELVYEMSIEGGGLKARGAAVLGSPYIIIGRGRNYAWSPTAGGSDNTDVRAELLCEPGGGAPSIMSDHYMFNGTCTPIFKRIDTWCAGDTTFCAMNSDNITATAERTVHGIVFARATVGGNPVALAKQRSTFFREGENAAAFARVNKNARRSRSFARAMRFAPGSFNWLYVNHKEISFIHSGLFPKRADGVDFDMPSWGTGEWEWTGFVHRRDHPQEINPEKGYFSSWNNKPAKDWRAADSNYSFGPTHRADSLEERLALAVTGPPITVAQMVEMMEDAGTVDLRGTQVLPLALQIIGAEPSLAPILTILDDWIGSGAFRRDRDGDGEYDHTNAVAIMDEWFPRMIDAAFFSQLGAFYGDIPIGFDNRPGAQGSAYQSGYYGYLQKAFNMVLANPVAKPFEFLRCDDGTPAGCRAMLVSSLNDAVAALTTTFASADPTDWRVDPSSEFIEFTPFGLAEVDPIPWVNRPTFQQVVQVETRRPQ